MLRSEGYPADTRFALAVMFEPTIAFAEGTGELSFFRHPYALPDMPCASGCAILKGDSHVANWNSCRGSPAVVCVFNSCRGATIAERGQARLRPILRQGLSAKGRQRNKQQPGGLFQCLLRLKRAGALSVGGCLPSLDPLWSVRLVPDAFRTWFGAPSLDLAVPQCDPAPLSG